MAQFYQRGELFSKVASRLVGVNDEQIVEGIISGVRDVYRELALYRQDVAQDAADRSVFFFAHGGWDFGKVIRFFEKDTGRDIEITTGNPTVLMQEDEMGTDEHGNPTSNTNQRTTITCAYFGEYGAGSEIDALAEVCLQPLDDTGGSIPDIIYRQYRDLFDAAAMTNLLPFLSPQKVRVDWDGKYRMLMDAAREKFSPDPMDYGRAHSGIRPPGGGWEEGGAFLRAGYFGPRRG